MCKEKREGKSTMYPTENLILSSPLMWICFALTAVFCFLEYKLSKKWIGIGGCIITQVAATVLLLFASASLADFLLYALGVLFIRLCFVMLERRKNG